MNYKDTQVKQVSFYIFSQIRIARNPHVSPLYNNNNKLPIISTFQFQHSCTNIYIYNSPLYSYLYQNLLKLKFHFYEKNQDLGEKYPFPSFLRRKSTRNKHVSSPRYVKVRRALSNCITAARAFGSVMSEESWRERERGRERLAGKCRQAYARGHYRLPFFTL